MQQIRLARNFDRFDDLSAVFIVTDSEGTLFAETVGPEAFNSRRAMSIISDRYQWNTYQ